tara:strand:- start:218 stop:1291 length:1074 start_codon:yes stop_codon:yes gene_type:complete
VYSDGAGSGAAFVDAFAALSVGAISGTSATFDGGVDIDNINIDGTTIALSSGDLTLDVAGDIILDADGAEIILKDAGTRFGTLFKTGNDFGIKSNVADGDLLFKGEDNATSITALTLDMSAAGRANFNAGASFQDHVNFGDNDKAVFGAGDDLQIYHDGSNSYVKDGGTGDLYLQGEANVRITDADGNKMFLGQNGGEVQLYYDASEKLNTTSTGINVIGTAVTDGVTVDGTLDIEEVFEKVDIASATSTTVTYDVIAQGIRFFNVNQTANRTINFTNVNANLGVGQSVTGSVLMDQGSTAYYLNAYQVDGSTVTPRWSGGAAPTEGNASGIDVYTFTIIKTADATFTVLASQTQFA